MSDFNGSFGGGPTADQPITSRSPGREMADALMQMTGTGQRNYWCRYNNKTPLGTPSDWQWIAGSASFMMPPDLPDRWGWVGLNKCQRRAAESAKQNKTAKKATETGNPLPREEETDLTDLIVSMQQKCETPLWIPYRISQFLALSSQFSTVPIYPTPNSLFLVLLMLLAPISVSIMFCGLASGLSLCNLVINHSGMRATEQNSILVRMAVCSSEFGDFFIRYCCCSFCSIQQQHSEAFVRRRRRLPHATPEGGSHKSWQHEK